MLTDEFLLPEEQSPIQEEDPSPLALRQMRIDARAAVASTEVGHEDEAGLMFAMLAG